MQTRQFPWEYQMDAKDCGPACIKMIAKYYGKYYSLQYLRDLCGITREGVSFLDISYAAEKIGLRTVAVKATMENLTNRIPLPCIIHWDQHHFIVVYKTKKVQKSRYRPETRRRYSYWNPRSACWLRSRCRR